MVKLMRLKHMSHPKPSVNHFSGALCFLCFVGFFFCQGKIFLYDCF